jgi:hypothetical protein
MPHKHHHTDIVVLFIHSKYPRIVACDAPVFKFILPSKKGK